MSQLPTGAKRKIYTFLYDFLPTCQFYQIVQVSDTPITLSCPDKDLCLLADTLNQSLEQLRAMQHCFEQGNAKNATCLGLSLHGHWWSRCTGRWMRLIKRGVLSSGYIFSLFYSSIFLLYCKVWHAIFVIHIFNLRSKLYPGSISSDQSSVFPCVRTNKYPEKNSYIEKHRFFMLQSK